MAVVRPFSCYRPNGAAAGQAAALPYDVYSRMEAREAVKGRPLSFLNIDRPDVWFPDSVPSQDERVYDKAKELLTERIREGTYVWDGASCYYIYRLTMDGRAQTGITACCSVDDYMDGVIRRHENTREEKEQDRINHVDRLDAHTGPIFLAYRNREELQGLVDGWVQAHEPIYQFTAEDGVEHVVWRVDDPETVSRMEEAFGRIPFTYIADGHHRAASAVKVGLKRRAENPDYTGEEPFNFFLSVLFPQEQLKILPYNRVVKDLNGRSVPQFLDEISRHFLVEPLGAEAFAPKEKGVFGMFLEERWYRLTAKPEILSSDPVKGLDVSVLQDWLLGPVLGIGDPRLDKRIDFIGGIRGLSEIERRARSDMKVGFSMYPTAMEELLAVADAGLLMPPKSTWFEPKLLSGIWIHPLREGEAPEK